MGRDRADQAAPDLFSTEAVRDTSPRPTKRFPDTEARTEPKPQRHVLPKNLRHAVKQLSEGELDELVEVVFDEAKRRGRLPRNVERDLPPSSRRPSDSATKPTPPTDKRRKVDIAEVALTQGQVNAVRAAFKVGITPSPNCATIRSFAIQCAEGVGGRSNEVSCCAGAAPPRRTRNRDASFNYLVSTGDQSLRQVETDRACSFEID
jgi:hypothetical protein